MLQYRPEADPDPIGSDRWPRASLGRRLGSWAE